MNQPAQSPIHHESSWRPIEGNAQEIVTALDRPLERIAHGEVPALVLRKAYPRASCAALVSRLIDRELLYDPSQPVPEHLREQSIPEGYVRLGLSDESTRDLPPADATATGKRRIDIGTSLGYRGSNPEEFFAHSAETHALFGSLLEGLDDPVETIYSNGSASRRRDSRSIALTSSALVLRKIAGAPEPAREPSIRVPRSSRNGRSSSNTLPSRW